MDRVLNENVELHTFHVKFVDFTNSTCNQLYIDRVNTSYDSRAVQNFAAVLHVESPVLQKKLKCKARGEYMTVTFWWNKKKAMLHTLV